MSDIVERLRSNALLPVCPYDRRSPDYWTAPNDKPCVICGQENTIEGPDLCRGADTRVMEEAANEIERLRGVAQAAPMPAEINALICERDHLRAGLESIVNFKNPMTRAAVREFAAEILETSPVPSTEHS